MFSYTSVILAGKTGKVNGSSITTHVDQRTYHPESANPRMDQQTKSCCGLVCAAESHATFSL